MVQTVKTPASKPKDTSSIPGSHWVEGELTRASVH